MVITNKKGQSIQISHQDYKRFNSVAWHVNDRGYVLCQQTSIHRLIMNAQPGQQVDHINRDKLDNRRKNLRICTPSLNIFNRIRGDNKSGTPGVRYDRGKWLAIIRKNNKHYWLGRFDKKSEAIKARKQAEAELYL